jgi:hypothetical protein
MVTVICLNDGFFNISDPCHKGYLLISGSENLLEKYVGASNFTQPLNHRSFYMKAQLASQLDNCNCDHMIHTQVFLTHHAEEYYFMLTKPQFTDD